MHAYGCVGSVMAGSIQLQREHRAGRINSQYFFLNQWAVLKGIMTDSYHFGPIWVLISQSNIALMPMVILRFLEIINTSLDKVVRTKIINKSRKLLFFVKAKML